MRRITSLDGLRGLAALNVVLCHHIAAFYPSLLSNNYPGISGNLPQSTIEKILSSPPVTLLFNGHAAVVIFFVLSGYVLTIPSSLKEPGRTLGRLLGRPIRLGLPAVAACIVSATLLFAGQYATLDVGNCTGSAWFREFYQHPWTIEGSFTYTATMGFYWQEMGLVPPMWTLRIELLASVYLLLALVVFSRARLIAVGSFLAFCLTMWPGHWPYYLAFAMGSLISLVKLCGAWPLIAGIGGIYFCAFQSASSLYWFLPIHDHSIAKEFYNVVGATLLVIGVKCGWLSDILDRFGPQFLGKISYSLYLIHFPVLGSIGAHAFLHSSGMVAFFISTLVSISVAWGLAISVDRLAISSSQLISRATVAMRLLIIPIAESPNAEVVE